MDSAPDILWFDEAADEASDQAANDLGKFCRVGPVAGRVSTRYNQAKPVGKEAGGGGAEGQGERSRGARSSTRSPCSPVPRSLCATMKLRIWITC